MLTFTILCTGQFFSPFVSSTALIVPCHFKWFLLFASHYMRGLKFPAKACSSQRDKFNPPVFLQGGLYIQKAIHRNLASLAKSNWRYFDTLSHFLLLLFFFIVIFGYYIIYIPFMPSSIVSFIAY